MGDNSMKKCYIVITDTENGLVNRETKIKKHRNRDSDNQKPNLKIK
jgi:hypothetical protein